VKFVFLIVMFLSSLSFASEGAGGGGGGNIKMDAVVVNLTGGGYISFTAQLKLADPKAEELVKAYMPVVRFEFIKAMIGKEGATVQTAQFMASFATQAAEFINKALDGDYVSDVFFTDWMVQ